MRSEDSLYVRSNHRRPRRRSSLPPLMLVTLVLLVVTGILALVHYGPDLFSPTERTEGNPALSTAPQLTDEQGQQVTPTPTATPSPTPAPANINSQLLPLENLVEQAMGTVNSEALPQSLHLVSDRLDGSGQVLAAFQRLNPISLLNPYEYNKVPGVLTFRGNNFRNAPAFGTASVTENTLTQVWEAPVGSLPSSSWSFSWTGTGWTGQPVLVQWDAQVRELMNIVPEKKAKENLVEVIYATMDGKIYFLDLDDGQPTRDPINIGAPIKGSPCVDPRGYPILYIGQGDKNTNVDGIGFRVFNLVDQSLLLYKECSDPSSYRSKWGACDSSPIFDAAADTLIYPNENGMIYTARMNTVFDPAGGTVSIDPEFSTYRYKMDGLENFGIESSIAIYGHYGYFSDNSGILNCVDLNTLQPAWSRHLEDDSDVTPVLVQKGSEVSLFTGTEVDWQQNIIGNYQGKAFVYKINALTGDVIWESSYDCWTKNAADNGDDINGGTMGTPVVGKQQLANLVIYSFCMTNGIYSGNTVVAFNQTDGSVAWEYKMPQYSWSSLVDIYDENGKGYLILPDSVGQLHLIDGLTGQALAVQQLTKNNGAETAGNIESSCAIFNNQLVIGTRGNVIVGVTIK